MTVPEAFKKLFSKPRYYCGVITQFFYVGVQVAVWTWTIKYIMTTEHIVEHEAVDYFIISMVLFIIFVMFVCT